MQTPCPLPQYLQYLIPQNKLYKKATAARAKLARYALTAHKPSPRVLETTFY